MGRGLAGVIDPRRGEASARAVGWAIVQPDTPSPGRDRRTKLASSEPAFWRGRRVLLTGHTGFKGAWLSLWLQSLGAELTGLSLREPPSKPSLYGLARVGEGMEASVVCDIRDAVALGARAGESAAGDRDPHGGSAARAPLVRVSSRDIRDECDGHGQSAGGGACVRGRARGGRRDFRQVLREPRVSPRLP